MLRAVLVGLMHALALAQGQSRGTLTVSVTVLPTARLEVRSATSASLTLILNRDTHALVWLSKGACGTPVEPRIFTQSGNHAVRFESERAEGKDFVCLVSSDAVLRSSARLPN